VQQTGQGSAGAEEDGVESSPEFVDEQRDQTGWRRPDVAFGGGGHGEEGRGRARDHSVLVYVNPGSGSHDHDSNTHTRIAMVVNADSIPAWFTACFQELSGVVHDIRAVNALLRPLNAHRKAARIE
jgi:hypothetical protein